MTPLLVPMPGAAFFIKNDDQREHLTVILCAPNADRFVALASVTTDYNTRGTDPACPLAQGDHAFIKHPSYMAYALATTRHCDELQSGLDDQSIRLADTFDGLVFARILQGARLSVHTPPRVLALL